MQKFLRINIFWMYLTRIVFLISLILFFSHRRIASRKKIFFIVSGYGKNSGCFFQYTQIFLNSNGASCALAETQSACFACNNFPHPLLLFFFFLMREFSLRLENLSIFNAHKMSFNEFLNCLCTVRLFHRIM